MKVRSSLLESFSFPSNNYGRQKFVRKDPGRVMVETDTGVTDKKKPLFEVISRQIYPRRYFKNDIIKREC